MGRWVARSMVVSSMGGWLDLVEGGVVGRCVESQEASCGPMRAVRVEQMISAIFLGATG